MKRKKLLQDELEQLEYKIACEMNWFRQEIKPLKDRKLQILEAEIKQLYKDTFQLEADQKNHMDKLEEKYGKVIINLEDGSITKDEKQD